MTSQPKVVLVGRPNVGKSTLFNRLVGKRKAIVDSTPGLTRDRQEGYSCTEGLAKFLVIDTAGFEHKEDSSIQAQMWEQTEKAIEQSRVVLFVIDGIAGVTPQDEFIAKYLRTKGKPIVCIVNKIDAKKAEPTVIDAHRLGFQETLSLSGAHGEGIEDLYKVLSSYVSEKQSHLEYDQAQSIREDSFNEEVESDNQKALQIAIIGRPNVGKSSLLNTIVAEDRLLVGPEAGMTRDSITLEWQYKGTHFELIDTAGLRKSSKRTEIVERLSVQKTQEAIRFAPITIALLDITRALEKQDLVIIHDVYKEGRCVIIGLNKWDLVPASKRQAYIKNFQEHLKISLPQAEGIPFVPLSAKTGFGLSNLFDTCLTLYKVWQKKIKTSQLNEWLEKVLAIHPPPLVSGRRIKIRYMTQKKSRPPTFLLFVNIKEEFPESYIRYMQRKLRAEFDFPGVPIRFILKKGNNPYHSKKP